MVHKGVQRVVGISAVFTKLVVEGGSKCGHSHRVLPKRPVSVVNAAIGMYVIVIEPNLRRLISMHI